MVLLLVVLTLDSYEGFESWYRVMVLMLALHSCSSEGLLALLHVGGEILASMQLAGLGRVCVRILLRKKGFEHEVQDIVCVYFNHSM